MRDKLDKMGHMAQEHLREAQTKQKVWYDKHARERELKPGQKVLLLLPSSTSKLLAKCQGPYIVSRKVGPVTYEILCPEGRRQKQILHVNLLREFKEREVTPDAKPEMMMRVAEDGDDETDMEPVRSQGGVIETPETKTKTKTTAGPGTDVIHSSLPGDIRSYRNYQPRHHSKGSHTNPAEALSDS